MKILNTISLKIHRVTNVSFIKNLMENVHNMIQYLNKCALIPCTSLS